ncbi:hybrid sensor histidine kinase/response regulator, partial [Crocosphaera watsonii]|uniref:hybrid sensor histidine kinase/response regulator n=1 Tax=Crocosphaera watsonii TaxID=263511 RepID=UPI00069D1749
MGDLQPEDAAKLLSEEEEEDMVSLMFQTEVDACLNHLESLLNDPQDACLREEFLIAAQELEGLGQMLELSPFSSLCQSIIQGIESHDDDLPQVAKLALQELRRSDAMVMIDQREMIPTELNLSTLGATLPDLEPHNWDDSLETLDEFDNDFFGSPEPLSLDISLDLNSEMELEESEEANQIVIANSLKSSATRDEFAEETENFLATLNSTDQSKSEDFIVPTTSQKIDTPKPQENETIRVPVKQLETLSDMFGELTIERNGLNLQLQRLRQLIGLLGDRIQTLESSNQQLRNSYDRITPQGEKQRERISTLLEGFDSLEMDSYNDLHLVSQDMMDTVVQLREVTSDLQLNLEDTESSSRAFSRTSKQMQTTITQLRMCPISDLLDRFPRGLREMEIQYGKKVDLKIRGGTTLVDRAVLEALNEPLLHLLRNAFDHGIESPDIRQEKGKPERGTIIITAAYRGNKTVITVEDDGGGINVDKIRSKALEMGVSEADLQESSKKELLDLIFEPGFSTASQVTDLSGRGVGMDVVHTNLESIQGDIQVNTQPGKGTMFTITVPFTLSVVRVLLVETAGMLLAFPNTVIEEMVCLNPEMLMNGIGQDVLNWDGYLVPIISLKQWFNFPRPAYVAHTEVIPVIDQPTVLMVAQGENYVGIQIDRYWGEQEVTIRQVEGSVGMPKGFAGCTILGDGRVVPLVDITALLHWLNDDPSQSSFTPKLAPTTTDFLETFADHHTSTIMVVDDSINVRRFLALTLEKAGYRVEQAKDGQDALEKLQGGLGSTVQLVISDIEMPRLDGYGFLSHLKSDLVCQHLPVIMLTSRSGNKHRQLA